MTNQYIKSFEELFDIFIKSKPKILDGFFEEIKIKIKYRSAEEILSMGIENATNGKYIRAMTIFEELSKIDETKKEISKLYNHIICSIVHTSEENNFGVDDIVLKETIHCMMESTRMYVEKEIPKEDFFNLENLIDRISFNKMKIKNRTEFNRIYEKFKEYCLDVFVGEKNDK
jgi:hypothetical protein